MLRRSLLAAMAVVLLSATPAAAQFSTVQYFGYFAARLTPSGGNHLAEVASRSNLNWVQISDVDRYRPEVLNGCRPRGCVVSTGNEFFTGCDTPHSTSCNLYSNFRQRWQRLAAAVRSRIGKVGAFYLLDEPQWRGASPTEIALAAQTIKETFPSIPVMMVEAGPAVTDALEVPGQVNWVGFDWYCRPFSDIKTKLATLERRTAPHQRLFLMPEAAPLAECGGAKGHATDAEIARLQWDYFHLAEAHRRVVGLLAFGFWTSGHGSSDLPLTVVAHRQIAARVIRPPAPTPQPPPPLPGGSPPAGPPLKILTKRARIDRHGRLRIALRCLATGGCSGRIGLSTHGRQARRLARKHFSLHGAQTQRVRVRIRGAMRRSIVRRTFRRHRYRVRLVAQTGAVRKRATLTLVPRRHR